MNPSFAPNSPHPPPARCPVCHKKPRPGRFTCSSKCADEWFSMGSKARQGYGYRSDDDGCYNRSFLRQTTS